MPLRGSLFRQIQKFKKQRREAEGRRRGAETIKIGLERRKEEEILRKLKRTRISEEGRSVLRQQVGGLKQQIAIEKARIAKAKKPSRIGKIESFLAKEAKIGAKLGLKGARKGAKLSLKELRKRVKVEINTGGTRTRRRKKRRKRKGR